MKECIVFGAGGVIANRYTKFTSSFNIKLFCDNNQQLWGEKLNGIDIISPDELKMNCSDNKFPIVIASQYHYQEIAEQLVKMGYENLFVFYRGLLFSYGGKNLTIPYEKENMEIHKKSDKELDFLFVQLTPCIRTNKIATLMRERGHNVSLMYLESPSSDNTDEYKYIYDNVYTFFTEKGMIDFVNNSEFDIIHSSNAPDYLTAMLINCSKPVIHDCHDMESLQGKTDIVTLTLESIVNVQSAGLIYTSESVKEIVSRMFRRDKEEIFVLENRIIKQVEIEKPYEKLSAADGQIHCVYEGGMATDQLNCDRYFGNIWLKLAECGIHIHFYTQLDASKCREFEKLSPYFHYEGNFSSRQLITEMTKYDCGIFFPNITSEASRMFLETGTANKIYEYINSGIPVAVSGVKAYRKLVEECGVGKEVDLNGDIVQQMKDVCSIKIPKNILNDRGLTMESSAADLESFYKKIIREYPQKKQKT